VARRARTAAGLVAILATLAIVAAAVTALPPAAGAAAPLRPSRTAASSAAFDRLPAAIVVLVGTVRPVPHPTRPHPSSSAALHRPPRDAFRAAPLAGHPTTLLIVLVVPARGPRAPRCGAEWTDRFAVAGGDPVNRGDPSGEAPAGGVYPNNGGGSGLYPCPDSYRPGASRSVPLPAYAWAYSGPYSYLWPPTDEAEVRAAEQGPTILWYCEYQGMYGCPAAPGSSFSGWIGCVLGGVVGGSEGAAAGEATWMGVAWLLGPEAAPEIDVVIALSATGGGAWGCATPPGYPSPFDPVP
jgi:hypothetical protein